MKLPSQSEQITLQALSEIKGQIKAIENLQAFGIELTDETRKKLSLLKGQQEVAEWVLSKQAGVKNNLVKIQDHLGKDRDAKVQPRSSDGQASSIG